MSFQNDVEDVWSLAEKQTVNRLAFENAKYYDCKESETLIHETPDEAILDLVEGCTGPGLLEHIKSICPIDIAAYNPRVIDGAMVQDCAERAMEAAVESLSNYEEYWDPDGDADCGLSKEEIEKATAAIMPALTELFAKTDVWGCEIVAHREYSAEEVEELIRKDNSDWFS
jgi:hypothetical protein